MSEMNKVAKKPELFDKFKAKYIKSSQATIKALQEKPKTSKIRKEE